jgi:hypothetical protein
MDGDGGETWQWRRLAGQGLDKLSKVSPCLMPTGKQQQQKESLYE